jgi:uncharacterized membrane protein
MMHDGYGLGTMFFPGFGILLQLLIFLGFIGIIYWVLKSGRISNESAEEILKKRLARGDIKKKEYEELLKEIRKK